MRAPVALEISERWVKVVAAKPSVRHQPFECLVKPIVGFNDEQIIQTIASTFRSRKLNARAVTVCLPRNLVTVRNLHLPSQDPKEIAQMIDLNIVRMVPYQKGEALSSYQCLGVDEIGYAKVLLAIVHRDLVKRHVHLPEAAGLSVERILLSSHGVWQWTVLHHRANLPTQDLSLLLDVDSTFADCVLFSRDHLFFSRSIAIEADQLVEEPGLSKLLGEVDQSLEIFQHEEMPKRPVKVFLSGAGASVVALEPAIAQRLRFPVVKVVSPLTTLGKGSAATASAAPLPLSLSAVAEMVSEESPHHLSFILPQMQIRQALKDKMRELILLGSLSVYLVTAIAGIVMSHLNHQHAYLKALHTRNAVITREIGNLVTQSERIEVVKQRLKERTLPLRYLAELQRLIPQEIALSFLSVDEQQQGVIRGQAMQLSDVFKLITDLEHSKHVDHVEAKYTRRKKVREKDLTEFELTVRAHL